MERHNVQSLGFQYGSERFRQEVTSHVVAKIVGKLYGDSSSSVFESLSSLIKPAYTFADKDYVPKAVESVYGKALETLIMEDIATFEKVTIEVVNTLAPKYFNLMANKFEEDLKKTEELKKSKALEEVWERVAESKKNKNLEETPSEDNVNK
jgi:hypothetical protein